ASTPRACACAIREGRARPRAPDPASADAPPPSGAGAPQALGCAIRAPWWWPCPSPLLAGRRREVDAKRVPLELCAFRGRFDKGTRQNEVASPGSHLQHELVPIPDELHLLLRGEGQVERQHVSAVLAADAVRAAAIKEARGIVRGEERGPESSQHLEADDLAIEERDGPDGYRRERFLAERLLAPLCFLPRLAG